MLKKSKLLLVLLFGLIILPGCPSFTSHQTAEVLDKDQIEFGETFGVIKYTGTVNKYDEDGNKTGEKDVSATLPYFPETVFRFGITDNMDAGFKIGLLSLEGDIKFQVLQIGDKKTSNFTLSLQPSLSYSVVMYKLALGVIASKRFNEMNVLYANIKYNYFGVSESTDTDTGSLADGSYFTAAFGYSLEGKKWWLRPEVSVALSTSFEVGFFLPSLGFGFKF